MRGMLEQMGNTTPLGRNVNTGDVGGAAVFALSDLGRGMTGDVMYVDAGYHCLGAWSARLLRVQLGFFQWVERCHQLCIGIDRLRVRLFQRLLAALLRISHQSHRRGEISYNRFGRQKNMTARAP